MAAGCLCIQCREWLKHTRSGAISIWCHVRHWHPESLAETASMAVTLDGSDHLSTTGIRLLGLEGKSSRTKYVTSCIPQGTVLGPMLFLVKINDLPQRVFPSHTRLFADDCLIIEKSVPKLTQMNFKMRYMIGNGSGLCLKWMSRTRLTATL